MASIISMSYWEDTGYQRNAYVVPGKSDVLPSPKGTYMFPSGDARPSTQDIFHAVNLPYAYTKLYKASYLGINYDTVDGRLTLYAWVDDVRIISDKTLPITRITYTIDLWRSYLAHAKFSYGLVQNRPRAFTDPIQNCSYRYRLPTSAVPLYQSDIKWVIISAQTKDKNSVSAVRSMVIPIGDSPTQELWIRAGDKTVKSPTFQNILDGSYDEFLGIDPDSVNSVFVSPVPPLPYVLDGTTCIIQTTGRPSMEKTTETINQPQGGYIAYEFSINRYLLKTYDSSGNPTNGTFENPYEKLSEDELKLRLVGWNGNLSFQGQTIKHTIVLAPHVSISQGYDNIGTFIWKGTINQLAKEIMGDRYDENKFTVTDRITVTGNILYVSNMSGTIQSFGNSGASIRWVVESLDTEAHVFAWQPSSKSFGDQQVFVIGQTAVLIWTHSKTTYAGDNQVVETKIVTESGVQVTYGYAYNGSGYYQEIPLTLPSEMSTTETSELIVTDMSGVPVSALPWGVKIKDYTARVIHSPLSAYVEFRFRGIDSYTSGAIATIPLPSVDLTTNAVSSYQISGQREYDMRQRQIASEQALIQGVSSAVTGGLSNAVFVSIGGGKTSANKGTSLVTDKKGNLGWTPTKFTTGINPMTAGAATVGLGAATSVVEYGLSLYHNGQLQKAEDQLKAKQAESLIAEGTGWDWVWHGRDISIVKLEIDSYSLDRYNADIDWNGISCSEPTSDITNLITTGGPLRISNAIVGGEIPVQARNFISNMLERGVYIKSNTSE